MTDTTSADEQKPVAHADLIRRLRQWPDLHLDSIHGLCDDLEAAADALEQARAASQPAQSCGHHASLAVYSAETGEYLYCELCDCRSARRDAEQREQELLAEVARLKASQPAQEPVGRVVNVHYSGVSAHPIYTLVVEWARELAVGTKLYAAPPADSWEETARQYAENARYWREKYESVNEKLDQQARDEINATPPATQQQAEPAPGYCPHCKQYTIAEPLPADDEAVRLLREAKDYLDRWEARPSLQLAIDAYLAKAKT